MNSISTISVPRWFDFRSSLTNEIELHIYCDASQIAYGTVTYLRCLEENANQYSVSFALSKSRLTPMKDRTLTILTGSCAGNPFESLCLRTIKI